ncbi:MAG TPA: sulfatase-like hydrolase/transferase [Candidatus Acidoferrum sp.]|nr:sulfatase-like hydrolase/transferase [Candidatus Acidoferrum sp.]
MTLLASPVAISFVYSTDGSPLWLAQALTALLLYVLLLWQICARVTNGLMRQLAFAGGCFVLCVFELGRALSFYFQGESFNSRFFYHLDAENAALVWQAYLWPTLLSVGYLSGGTALAIVCIRRVASVRPWPLAGQVLLLALIVVLEPESARLLAWRLQENAYAKQFASGAVEPQQIAALHLNAGALDTGTGKVGAGRNLVLIYLESLEATYLNEKIFGPLAPNLQRFMREGLTFTQIQQTAGTSFTMAGIVSSQCGTPMLFEVTPSGNDIMQNGFLNHVTCLGDILHAGGYHQVFMGGAPLRFAGKGRFLLAHHYDEVLGRIALSAKLPDRAYQTGWGLYDDSLFTLASETFMRLADTAQPFNLSLLTLDTHHPNGAASASCKPYAKIDNSILHAVHCTDQLLKRFIDTISRHPAWANTIVVLVSDHYAMRNAASAFYPPVADRRLLFTVLNAPRTGEVVTPGTHMDIAPTILELLGVKHEAVFLAGNSLLDADAYHFHAEELGTARNDMIEFLNSHMLTTHTTSLCQEKNMLEVSDTIHIAGKDVAISYRGAPLPDGSLQRTHTFIGLFDDDGYLESSMIVPNEAVAATLFTYREYNFITLGNDSALPDFVRGKDAAAGAQRLVSLIGNLLGPMYSLQVALNDKEITVASPSCDLRVSSIKTETDHSKDMDFVKQRCLDSNTGDIMNPTDGSIFLNRVRYNNGWFEATLRLNRRRQYEPSTYTAIEGAPPDSYCDAYVSDDALVIPNIHIGQQQQTLSLRKAPGADLVFLPSVE